MTKKRHYTIYRLSLQSRFMYSINIYNLPFRTEPTENSKPKKKKKKAAEKQTTTTKMQPEISDRILYSFLTGGSCALSTTTTTSTTRSSFYPFAMEETSSQDEALANTLRKHREGERMRRERINSNLNKLRNLLSCNSKVQILLSYYFSLTESLIETNI